MPRHHPFKRKSVLENLRLKAPMCGLRISQIVGRFQKLRRLILPGSAHRAPAGDNLTEKIMKRFYIIVVPFVLLISTLSSSDAVAKYRSPQVCKEICAASFKKCVATDHTVWHRNFCSDARWKCQQICVSSQCQPGEICR